MNDNPGKDADWEDDVSQPMIVRFFSKLPRRRPGDDDDLWSAGIQSALRDFRDAVANNYTEGTLLRLLESPSIGARQAATLALGLLGTMDASPAVATRLKDDDATVRRFAHDALWEIWFRGTNPSLSWKLREALQLNDHAESLEALNDLIRTVPDYAEAFNQRAILFFRRGEFSRSALDCERVLRMNPQHFGAASGMGQCFLRLKKPRAALRAFRTALDINPDLDSVREAVDALSAVFGDD